jgi:hypothetical protein
MPYVPKWWQQERGREKNEVVPLLNYLNTTDMERHSGGIASVT